MAQEVATHLPYPFRWGSHGNAVEIDQDTDDEIINCVEVIVITPVGSLVDQGDFGAVDFIFQKNPSVITLTAQINKWEPRANVEITTQLDSVDSLMRLVEIQVAAGNNS